LSSSQFSNFQFTTIATGLITGIDQASDTATVYQSPGAQTAGYNNLNQLTNLSGQSLSYDANGNLLSDGKRNYTWDAENRLVGITYPAQPGKATTFTYDGLSRRTAITSTPAGGGTPTTTSYLWCGLRICQARNASGPSREYYGEGEFVPGLPGQPYYYGTDQIGSVQRVFASTSSAPAYGYDPYGNPLQTTPPLTELGYAGMLYNADSGLYLTQYRAYDPTSGRWLSRDPIGETDWTAGLYAYANNDPLNLLDPYGLAACGNSSGPQNLTQLLGLILATEVAGLGPEDPAADAAVLGEIAAYEGGAFAAEGIAGGAQSALAAPALAGQLASESAASAFTAEGTLTQEALANSTEIIPSSQLGNPNIPAGFSKFTTQTFQSPAGNFQAHFYMNPATGEAFYGLDYKAIFNSGGVGR
jgi:RHS repeat-associated protein